MAAVAVRLSGGSPGRSDWSWRVRFKAWIRLLPSTCSTTAWAGHTLRKAQAEGYFKPIGFLVVDEFNQEEAHFAIVCAAIDRLEAGLGPGFGHHIMARADDKARACAILSINAGLAPQRGPVLLHSGLKQAEQRESLRRLRAGESRIVVCVDMLGEGLDLPELKIAAIHDPHESLAITLQFTSRFTRFRADPRDAMIITDIADRRVEDALHDHE